jgi:hypothetical protein
MVYGRECKLALPGNKGTRKTENITVRPDEAKLHTWLWGFSLGQSV